MRHQRITRSTALGLALAALAAPTAAAQQQDLRSPDTRDAARAAATAAAPQQDLRSPDTRDTARSSTAAAPRQDLRSPDLEAMEAMRDAALLRLFAPRSPAARAVSSTPARPRQDLRNPDARAVANARAQGRYYSSYGEPEPLTLPQSPAPSDDTPWLPIALSITGALVIAAASTTQLRRLRLRRRRAVRSTA
jgi:hypothetical protein